MVIEKTLKMNLQEEPHKHLGISIPGADSVLGDWMQRSCRLLVAYDETAPHASTMMELRTTTLGAHHVDTLSSLLVLSGIHIKRADFAEAEPLLLEAYEAYSHHDQSDGTSRDLQQYDEILRQLIRLSQETNQADQVQAWTEKLRVLSTGKKTARRPE